MAKRQCIAASSAANKSKKFDTNATSWGQLKSDANLSGLLTGNVEVIVYPGNVTLSRDEAELPEGDFKIYIVPTKNKAGMDEDQADQLADTIGDAIRSAARRASEEDFKDLSSQLIAVVESFFNIDLSCPECEETLQEAHNLSQQ